MAILEAMVAGGKSEERTLLQSDENREPVARSEGRQQIRWNAGRQDDSPGGRYVPEFHSLANMA
jgi:hypothetical protein